MPTRTDDRLEEIERNWARYDGNDDGPPVSDVRWLIAEVRRLRAEYEVERSYVEHLRFLILDMLD